MSLSVYWSLIIIESEDSNSFLAWFALHKKMHKHKLARVFTQNKILLQGELFNDACLCSCFHDAEIGSNMFMLW